MRDGDALHGSAPERLESADHLYGFAAECALLGCLCILHQAGVYPDLSLSPEGAVADDDLRRSGHIRELWSHMWGRVHRIEDSSVQRMFQPFSGHRDGGSKNPFRDWSVFDRYRADGFVIKDRVVAHRRAAELCIRILAVVEQSYLKRGGARKEGS